MAIYGLAPTGVLVRIGVPVKSLGGLSGPAILGLTSRRVGDSKQGQLQGANTSLSSIAGLIGPGLFAMTSSRSLDRMRAPPSIWRP